ERDVLLYVESARDAEAGQRDAVGAKAEPVELKLGRPVAQEGVLVADADHPAPAGVARARQLRPRDSNGGGVERPIDLVNPGRPPFDVDERAIPGITEASRDGAEVYHRGFGPLARKQGIKRRVSPISAMVHSAPTRLRLDADNPASDLPVVSAL